MSGFSDDNNECYMNKWKLLLGFVAVTSSLLRKVVTVYTLSDLSTAAKEEALQIPPPSSPLTDQKQRLSSMIFYL